MAEDGKEVVLRTVFCRKARSFSSLSLTTYYPSLLAMRYRDYRVGLEEK
jgi:hypothetical protein